MSYLIGIGHRSRQGKTTLANFIHHLAPRETQVYNFSDSMVHFCRVSGMMRERDNNLLQVVGEAFRQKDPAFWIKMLRMSIEDDSPRVAIIAGVRHQNEFDWIKVGGGIVVRVNRLLKNGDSYEDPRRNLKHVSELALEGAPFDYSISAQDGDLLELAKSAKKLWDIVQVRLK